MSSFPTCTLFHGGVSERPKEHASKACVGATSPWVQIPPPPPKAHRSLWVLCFFSGGWFWHEPLTLWGLCPYFEQRLGNAVGIAGGVQQPDPEGLGVGEAFLAATVASSTTATKPLPTTKSTTRLPRPSGTRTAPGK